MARRSSAPQALERFVGKTIASIEEVLPCGVPIGILFDERVVTKHPLLKDMLDFMREAKKSSQIPVHRGEVPEYRKRGYVNHVVSWRTRTSWRGSRGNVHIYAHWKTKHVVKVFKPDWMGERTQAAIETTELLRQYGQSKAEEVARAGLLEVLSEEQRRELLLSDAFVEVGKSGVSYLVRRNRPTLAYRVRQKDVYQVLCALCLHPLLYYESTWAGGMPPSDEMLAHLMLIRADEHLFWQKANQIECDEWNSGF